MEEKLSGITNNKNNVIVTPKIRSKSIENKTEEKQDKTIGYVLEKSKHGYLMATFTSLQGNHSIKVEIDISRREILVSSLNIGKHSPVEFVIMLKLMVTEMQKMHIQFVIQQVTKNDWVSILRPQGIFTLVNENRQYGFLNVKCPISEFPEAVICALGFSDIEKNNNDTY
jgi:hypothetical protein